MQLTAFRQKLKPWMLPLAMLTGIILHHYIGHVAFLSKYLIFIMLLITYCRVKLRDFRLGAYIWWPLALQIGGATMAYLLIRPFSPILAQGAFICIFCPTATAAPVITGMLGGNVSRVATYSLFSHISVALLSPLLLSWIAGSGNPAATGITFTESVSTIGITVLPLILGPLIIALMMQRFAPKAHRAVATRQGLSFYIWALALIIVVGNSVSFILHEPSEMAPEILMLAAISLAACIFQFTIGRRIGSHYGDKIATSQSLGQKNTILAIWLTLTYLNPIISVAPAAYVAWHNTFNSLQIYRHEKSTRPTTNPPTNTPS